MKKSTIISIVFSLFAFSYLIGQNDFTEKKDEELGLDSSIKHGQLNNGFTYYLKDNDSKVIQFFLVVKAGSEMTDFDQIEYAHVLEHTGMNSTKNFPDLNDFSKIKGRSKFARTGRYHTGYYMQVPSEDRDGIQLGIQLIRDLAQNINVDQKNIDKARGAVLGEMRVKDYHQRLGRDKIDSVLIRTTNFPSLERKRYKENVQNFDRQAFLRFYKDWYRPDLQALIIVGDIDIHNLETQVKQMLSDLEIPANLGKGNYKIINKKKIVLNGKTQFITLTDTIKPNFRIEFFSKRLNAAYQAKDKSNLKKLLLQKLYERILKTRSQRLREKYDPAFNSFRPNYSVIPAYEQLYVSSMSVELKNDDPKYIRNMFQSALTAWKQMHENITPAELHKEKESLLHNSNFEDTSSLALALKYQDHFVSGTPALHPEEEKRIMLKLLGDISLEEITEFTSAYGDFSKNTDFIFINDGKSKVPRVDTIKNWISEIIKKDVPPLAKPAPAIKSLSETINLPNESFTLVKSDYQNAIGIHTVILKNGIKLILKPTKASSKFYSNTVDIKAVQP
ncbi:MAG: M16 family metallopeptidase, partial [Flavobacteriales bacterium]